MSISEVTLSGTLELLDTAQCDRDTFDQTARRFDHWLD